jgi:hypothetical protein
MAIYKLQLTEFGQKRSFASDGLPQFLATQIATMKNQYRITKYDPSLRDATGAYAGCDWTSRSDIRRVFDGGLLSEAAYLKVENGYLFAMESFLDEAGIESLELKGLERRDSAGDGFVSGGNLTIAQSLDFARLVLREEAWGKLVVPGKV